MDVVSDYYPAMAVDYPAWKKTIEDERKQRELAVLKGQPILYTKKEDLSDAVYAILCEFGIKILHDMHFSNILTDHLNFKNNPPIKHVLKDLSKCGGLKELSDSKYDITKPPQLIRAKICHHLVWSTSMATNKH